MPIIKGKIEANSIECRSIGTVPIWEMKKPMIRVFTIVNNKSIDLRNIFLRCFFLVITTIGIVKTNSGEKATIAAKMAQKNC